MRLRATFLLLILTNLLFFAWTQGYFGSVGEGHEPQRLANQLEPEKLRIVGMGAPPLPPLETCRLVSGLARDEALRLRIQAEEKFPGLRVVVKTGETRPQPVYWVHIPALANRLAADKKLSELKHLGLSGFFVVLEEGAYKFAISLGQFENEPAAVEFLQGLAKRGVRSARLQVHEKAAEKPQLEVRGPVELLDRQLPAFLAGQVTASIGDCPAGP